MLRAKRQECSASYLQHPKTIHLVDIQSLYTSTAFKMMYIRFISSGQVSQHPDARGNGYPCTSCAKHLTINSYKYEENNYCSLGSG